MGYDEVNLNLGCPSGTVTAKGKGAGMLADLEGLDRFLDGIFSAARGKISVKTRLGLRDPEEIFPLLERFARYPISLLILHPRVRQDFYKEPVRPDYFARALEVYPGPMCYNGGLRTPDDCAAMQGRFPQVRHWMLGQGLLADPALIRRCQGGPALTRQELRAFHDELYHTYLDEFKSQRNTVFHMKELWNYLSGLFDQPEKPLKRIRKADASPAYESAVDELFAHPFLAEKV